MHERADVDPARDRHDTQVVVPPAFVALFVPPGRSRPAASREHIAARHEFCEDLAQLLVDAAAAQLAATGDADVVLQRVAQGLAGGGAGVTDAAGGAPDEAGWVLSRLAELLGWAQPSPPPADR